MKKLLLSLALLAPMTAMADIDLYSPYIGLSIAKSTYDFQPADVSASPHAAVLNAGFAFNDVFGLEALVGIGANADKFDSGEKLEIKSMAGVFLRGNFEINNKLLAYGLLGYMTQRLEASDAGWSDVDNKDDGALGAGLEYNLNDSGWTVRGGVLQAARGAGVDNMQYSLGMAYRY